MKYSRREKQCNICNYKSNTYNWPQVLGRVIPKHDDSENCDGDFTKELRRIELQHGKITEKLTHVKNF